METENTTRESMGGGAAVDGGTVTLQTETVRMFAALAQLILFANRNGEHLRMMAELLGFDLNDVHVRTEAIHAMAALVLSQSLEALGEDSNPSKMGSDCNARHVAMCSAVLDALVETLRSRRGAESDAEGRKAGEGVAE